MVKEFSICSTRTVAFIEVTVRLIAVDRATGVRLLPLPRRESRESQSLVIQPAAGPEFGA
jgi:hypothetical protein